jgi:hypothetical protein
MYQGELFREAHPPLVLTPCSLPLFADLKTGQCAFIRHSGRRELRLLIQLSFYSMPVEHVRVVLKPNNFFKWSPAIDVRAIVDKASKVVEFNTNGSTSENGNGHSVSDPVGSCCN